MSSFLRGTEAELFMGTQVFSTLINSSPESYGVSEAQAQVYAELSAAYVGAYQAATTPETRTKSAVAAKNSARKQLLLMGHRLARFILNNADVSDQQKIDLGLSVPKVRARIPVPAVAPEVDVIEMAGPVVTVRVHDAATLRRGKPTGSGIRGAAIYTAVDEAPPNASGWIFRGNATRSRFEIDLTGIAPGTKVWISAAWYNPRGELGPMSRPVSAYTQFGGGIVQIVKGLKAA